MKNKFATITTSNDEAGPALSSVMARGRVENLCHLAG